MGQARPSATFVRAKRVRLRYDAFPHQRYGQHEGLVRKVVHADLTSDEVSAIAEDPALAQAGPLFRVEVELARQALEPPEQGTRLLPTMTLEADVVIETRRIWEWVLTLDDALAGQAGGGGA